MSTDDRSFRGQTPEEANVASGADSSTELDLDAIEADLAEVEAELARLDEDDG